MNTDPEPYAESVRPKATYEDLRRHLKEDHQTSVFPEGKSYIRLADLHYRIHQAQRQSDGQES